MHRNSQKISLKSLATQFIHGYRLFHVRHLSKWRRWVETAVDTTRLPTRELQRA